jgi:hypothetical protein
MILVHLWDNNTTNYAEGLQVHIRFVMEHWRGGYDCPSTVEAVKHEVRDYFLSLPRNFTMELASLVQMLSA